MLVGGRNLDEVVDKIISIIPKDEHDLINSLKNQKTDLFNIAPEIKYRYWNDVANILRKYIPTNETEWHKKVEEEFSGSNKGG